VAAPVGEALVNPAIEQDWEEDEVVVHDGQLLLLKRTTKVTIRGGGKAESWT